MFSPRIAWGLDIGESTVKAVKMRRTKMGAEILAFDIVERGFPSEQSGDKDFHLRKAVTTLAERNNFAHTPVVVSIPEPAFSRFIPLPPVDKRRIPEVVKYEARQQIPFPIDEVVWDYQPVSEATEVGEETEVAIFSLRSQFVHALLQNLKLCGVRPTAVLPVPLALYNYLTFDRDVAKGTIVVDIGAGSTDILICDPENFRVRNITVSGNGISRALAERLKIGHAEAEALKRACTDKVQAERLFKLMQPTLVDLIGQVQRTIGFFKSQIHNVRIEQALLLGNTFKMPGVNEFFTEQLGCDQIPADMLERITLAGTVDGTALKQNLPSLAAAAGLALQGIGQGRVQVNLMPHELLWRQEVATKRPYAAAAVGCLAVMLGAHLLSLTVKRSNIQHTLERQKVTTKLVGDVRSIQAKYNTAKDGVSGARSELDQLVDISRRYRACAEATNAINRVLDEMSADIILDQMTLEQTKATFLPEEYGGKPGSAAKELPAIEISIAGTSRNIDPRFMQSQIRDRIKFAETSTADGTRRVFGGVGYIPAIDKDGLRQFKAVCHFPVSDD